MFAVIGIAGLFLALARFLLSRDDPPDGSAAEASVAQTPFADTVGQWFSIFRLPAARGLMLGFGGVNYTVWFYIAWLRRCVQSRILQLSHSFGNSAPDGMDARSHAQLQFEL
jgi:hypothetical protein